MAPVSTVSAVRSTPAELMPSSTPRRGSLATIEEAESKYEQSELPVNAHGVRESVLNHYSQIFFIDDEERSMYIDEDEEKNYGMTLEVSQDFPFNRALSEIKDYQNKPTLDL